MEAPITNFFQPTPFLVEHIRDLKRGKVLDIGSGNGRNVLYLAKEGFEVTALDSDRESLKTVSEIASDEGLVVKIISEDVRLFETTEKYDLIVCLMVLHFLNHKEIESVIDWMKKHTNTGGMNVISAFTTSNPRGTRPHLFDTDEIEAYYAGWNIRSSEYAESSILENGTLTTYSVVRTAVIKI